MADLQPCDLVGLALGCLLESTINNRNQTTTAPILEPRLRDRLVNRPTRPTHPPGSASNPVHIPDDAPSDSIQEIIVIPDDGQPQAGLGSQYIGALPEGLHYQHSSLGLQNASAISNSLSTSPQQPHLSSTPDLYSTFQTPPSSAKIPIVSGPSKRHDSSQTTPNVASTQADPADYSTDSTLRTWKSTTQDLKLVQKPSVDRRDCQRNAHTDMSQTLDSFSDRWSIPQDSPSADDDMLVNPSSSDGCRDHYLSPSPAREISVKDEMTIVRQKAEGSSVASAMKSEDLLENIKMLVICAASPDVQKDRSPVTTMTQIREEHVSPHLVHKMEDYIPSQDGRRTPEPSSQTIGNKRPRKPKPSELLTEKRQKTDVQPPKLCLIPPGKIIDELDEGFWLDSELHIRWKDLCYMLIFEAPNHSTNLKQLHILVTNWLRNTFPTHTTIHNQADAHYLETIMRASPQIKYHMRSRPSKNSNPIDFSVRKDGIPEIETTVKVFRFEVSRWKYQMCTLKYRPSNTKPRPGISFENLIGIALRQAKSIFLSQEQLAQWIEANVPGYDCEGWVPWMLEELFASSFFKHRNSGKGKEEWTFRKGYEEFFKKRLPERATCGREGCKMIHRFRWPSSLPHECSDQTRG